MDWNALGTWAAVLVALGIALKDTFQRWRERTARHLLVTATIYPQIGQTLDALREKIEDGKALLAYPGSPMTKLVAACDEFLEVTSTYGLSELRELVADAESLPEHILVPLAKAITLTNMLVHNGQLERSGLVTDEKARIALADWCEHAESIVRSLDWVDRAIRRKLESKRWTNPEEFEW